MATYHGLENCCCSSHVFSVNRKAENLTKSLKSAAEPDKAVISLIIGQPTTTCSHLITLNKRVIVFFRRATQAHFFLAWTLPVLPYLRRRRSLRNSNFAKKNHSLLIKQQKMIKIHYVCEQFIINQALIEMMNQGELDTDK